MLTVYVAECWQISPAPGCSAANPQAAVAAVDRWETYGRTDGQTDRRTPVHYIDPAPYTTRAASIHKFVTGNYYRYGLQ